MLFNPFVWIFWIATTTAISSKYEFHLYRIIIFFASVLGMVISTDLLKTFVANKIKNAGAIFLGPYSPTALGDYAAGPSHVLPTLGTAKFFSGLGVSDFVKRNHIISYSKRALEKLREPVKKIATLEGLTKHSDSVNIRF